MNANVVRSYVSTARKQGQSAIDTLHSALIGNSFIPQQVAGMA